MSRLLTAWPFDCPSAGGWVLDVGRHGILSFRYLQGKRRVRIGDPSIWW